MKTQDLFQFEPFNDSDLLNFPRESAGKDYSLNWALANEWFTVWGNAYRNPSADILKTNSKGELDENQNAVCTRTYIASKDVQTKKGDFGDISDSVKEFLSQVPNLYVEDAGVCSGRCAELRIRSVTNDPVTAMALKNMLHRMPKRDAMTPHPLSVIVARGMEESFTVTGMDPHSKALTVLATGDTPIERVLEEVAKATMQQMDTARGTVEVTVAASEPDKPATKVSKKGPVVQSVVRGSVLSDKQGNTVLVCGLSADVSLNALKAGALYCSDNAVLTSDGVSRVFAGEEVDAKELTVNNNVIVNGKAFVPVAGDNLLNFPNKVIFVDQTNKSVDAEEATMRMKAFCCCEDTAKFCVDLLKNNGAEFVCGDVASVQS
ncbi:hypothetical protein JH06_5552, partial [Blastocystis sp. subtype 4]|uniref:hypothetical protein n=1 Tax=Blastocystis sp. subtype 4 TaxID=944170 RepID=UPI0007114A7E